MKAILWRELKVAFSSPFSLVMQFALPLFLLVFFATVLSNNIGKIAIGNAQVSYVEFFSPGLFGYITFLLFSLSFSFIRMDKQTGMLAIIALSKSSLVGYYWAKFTAQLLLVAIKVLLLAALTCILTKAFPPLSLWHVPLFLLALLFGSAIWYSVGLIGAVLVQRDDLREILMILTTLPVTFASSMYYNVNVAPLPIRWIASVNPLTYTCNILRGSFLDALPPDTVFQLTILCCLAVISAALALLSLRKLKF